MNHVGGTAVAVVLACTLPVPAGAVASGGSVRELLQLSLEELSNLPVETASRTPEQRWRTAASTYVITQDDIRRAGVQSLPEALRLAPGVEVARVGVRSWAIAIRGFNGDLSNKLLVMIDGRSVYSPLFAGVFWDVLDVPPSTIERIEIVGGPGGALWGANAVNGVINVVTRRATSAQENRVEASAGDGGFRTLTATLGAEAGPEAAVAGYVRHLEADAFGPHSDGVPRDWQITSLGGQWERAPAEGTAVVVQADAYVARDRNLYRAPAELGRRPAPDVADRTALNGASLRAQWARARDERHDWRLAAYLEHTRRDIPNTYDERRTTAFLSYQQRAATERHDVLWGAELRLSSDHVGNTAFATFDPARRTTSVASAFAQDRWHLGSAVDLIGGVKLEYNDYTGVEVLPSLRLWVAPGERSAFWAAVSQAVRTPSRLDSDLRVRTPLSVPGVPLPVGVQVDGTPEFDRERLTAFELGYRVRLQERASLELAAYRNEYHRLQTQETLGTSVLPGASGPYLFIQAALANGMYGTTQGGTAAVELRPSDRWRVQVHYSYIDYDLQLEPWSRNVGALRVAGRSPRQSLALHTYLDLPAGFELYAGVRRVAELPALGVPRYTAVDASLRWRNDRVELALSGRNLTDPHHVEFGTGVQNEIERTVYGTVDVRF